MIHHRLRLFFGVILISSNPVTVFESVNKLLIGKPKSFHALVSMTSQAVTKTL